MALIERCFEWLSSVETHTHKMPKTHKTHTKHTHKHTHTKHRQNTHTKHTRTRTEMHRNAQKCTDMQRNVHAQTLTRAQMSNTPVGNHATNMLNKRARKYPKICACTFKNMCLCMQTDLDAQKMLHVNRKLQSTAANAAPTQTHVHTLPNMAPNVHGATCMCVKRNKTLQ